MEGSIKERFNTQFIRTPWDWLKFWFKFRQIRRQKMMLLWEATMDKFFMETSEGYILAYREDADRRSLTEENRKPLAEQDSTKIGDLEDRIARAKAVKQTYRKTNEMINELNLYLEMLKKWNG